MPVCKNVDWKYIREYEGGIQVLINRESVIINKKFSFRKHGGYEGALKEAQKYRDEKHLEYFKAPVTKRYFHLSRRKGSESYDNELKIHLPAGISITRINEIPFYVVAVWSPRPNKVLRKRFSIKKLGLQKALDDALKHRINELIELD